MSRSFPLIAAVLVAICIPLVAMAQDKPLDGNYPKVVADRGAYGRVVYLFGDSISRGIALDTWADELEAQGLVDPLSPMRSPAAMFNFMSLAPASEVFAVYVGNLGQPTAEGVARVVRQMETMTSIVRPGDVFVFEDAGDHRNDPKGYEANWRTLREAAGRLGAQVVMMTMPDNLTVESYGGFPADQFRYDVKFGGVSHNDTTRAAAHWKVDGKRATLIDFDARMDALDKALGADGLSGLKSDGIHPNVWGQCLLVTLLADALKAPIGHDGAVDLVGRNHAEVHAPSAEVARRAMAACLPAARR